MSVQPTSFIMVVMRKGSILQKKQVSCILPFENNWPNLFLEHGTMHHSPSLSKRANHLWGSEPKRNSQFGPSLHFFNRPLWVTLCPVSSNDSYAYLRNLQHETLLRRSSLHTMLLNSSVHSLHHWMKPSAHTMRRLQSFEKSSCTYWGFQGLK